MVALDIRVGDVVQLRKAHPCGSDLWKVVRTGADIGALCSGCGRRVMLDRGRFQRRVKAVVQRGPAPTPDEGS
ncbi:MAG: DUF951 domain-containing protein [Dehalococcoidia bacterium]|nr:DUF951 domain-containing protein [Dehalococcoidia bacterium]